MADVVLSMLNAKYLHAAFGLRYLLANMGELESRTVLLEFDLQQRPAEIVEVLLAHRPSIIGLGVYIWNVRETERVIALLKRLRPDIRVVLGGPEVSHETDRQSICALADLVIQGEADLAFAQVCRQLLEGRHPVERIISAPMPDLTGLRLPYRHYTDEDLAHRVVYVEASRGCPFTCEFCLSSLEAPVRPLPLERILEELQRLLDRGLRHFKFVDRTFNLNIRISRTILEFFHQRLCPGLFLHFEMIPDRFPGELRNWVQKFPAKVLQLEIGIQTFNPAVADRIRRRQDYTATETNLRFLRQQTGAHLHTDLIVGLPGESLESFADGFNRLLDLDPHEIQVGILKRLRGTPIVRHDQEWGMIYSPEAPYEILENRLIDFPTMQSLRRFARAWDLVANSGNFTSVLPWIWRESSASPFHAFLHWTDWLHRQAGQLHGIALNRLTVFLYRYLTEVLSRAPGEILSALRDDYARTGRNDLPPELTRTTTGDRSPRRASTAGVRKRRRRQARHPQ